MITVKKFKKILSAVSAAVLCAMPLANGMAANAAGITKTYRVYFDVPANSGVASANYSMTYSKHMSEAFMILEISAEALAAEAMVKELIIYAVVIIQPMKRL